MLQKLRQSWIITMYLDDQDHQDGGGGEGK